MTQRRTDTILSAVLMLIAAAWTVTVWRSIPGGFGPGDIGARGFPLVLGFALAGLSSALLVKTLRRPEGTSCDPLEESETGGDGAGSGFAVLMVVAHVAAYGFMFERLGFLVSTFLTVPSMLFLCTGMRSFWKLSAYAFGTAILGWLIFGKLMGVHLPAGTWIRLG